jgi:hypothetical protein
LSNEHQQVPGGMIDSVIAELKERVTRRYPAATFDVFEGKDPDGTYLRAVVDVEDVDEVLDLVIDRLLPLQVEDHLPLYFVVLRPLERTLRHLRVTPPIQWHSLAPVN